MLRDGVDDDFAIAGHGIHLDLFGMLDKLAHYDRVFLRYVGGQLQELFQLGVVRADVHRSTREHIRGTNQHGVTHLFHEVVDVGQRGQLAPTRLVDTQRVEHRREFVSVFGVVYAVGRRAQYAHVLLVEARGQVVGYLSAGRENYAVRILEFENIHHPLEGQLVEVEAVAHVVVGRYRFGVVVDHYTAVALFANGIQGLHAAPVELNRRAYAVSTRTQYHNRLVVAQVLHIVGDAAVGQVQIVGLCRILGGQRVDLFHHGDDAERFTELAHPLHVAVFHLFLPDGAGNLEIGEALYLGPTHEVVVFLGILGAGNRLVELFQVVSRAHDIHQFLQEPAVYFGQFMYLVYRITGAHGLADDKDTFVGRLV